MYFTGERIKRLIDEIGGYIYKDSMDITPIRIAKGDFTGKIDELDEAQWEQFTRDQRWGGKDLHFWFRIGAPIPDKYRGNTVVCDVTTGREGEWDALNPQFFAYVNGKLVQALDVNHREFVLTDSAAGGELFNIALYAYSGRKDGLVQLNVRIRTLDRETERLYYNLKVPYEITRFLDQEDKKHIDILNYLNEAVNILDLRKPFSDSYRESVKAANDFMESEFYGKYCGNQDVVAYCVGHTHIDVAWLWTLSQTREKAGRSFSTVLKLMEHYPEYIFMSSQPQLYKFVKEDYPDIYAGIKKRIKEGRWEADGAMWLEADCNLTSGESLVRQILFGTRFFQREFGVKNRILWLPDVFGYSAALPQILKKSGIDYFMTTKISWSEYNKMPYDSFIWKGIDGTGILTHFITTMNPDETSHTPWVTSYNGNLVPAQIMSAWKRYQQKDISSEVLVSFGYGDGGGGPTREMLENARRMEKGIPGCPRVKMSKAVDFFDSLNNKQKSSKKFPEWVGELYLEYHRGTYTSMARNKRFNRKSELLYQDTELMSVINMATSASPSYPQDKINSGWERILLNQFHDILPGSSIREVYEESKADYERIIGNGRDILSNQANSIASKVNLNDGSLIVFNQLGFERSDVVEFDIPEGMDSFELMDTDGSTVDVQVVQKRKAVFFAEKVPPKGYKAYTIKRCSSAACDGSIKAEEHLFDNKFFTVKFDENYNISSIFDKNNGREVIMKDSQANVLQAFEDKPIRFDAWDINLYYQEKMWRIDDVESAEIIENGPVRAKLRVKRRFLDSTLSQDIIVYRDLPRIDFATTVDWKEKQILLKTAFPIDVHGDKATYDIQFGNVERPTHWNTSWDYARFEVCAHKWADLSEDGFGVSILNDCKYGHDIKDGVMRLTLLKSAINPNEDADREVHEFVYSLYPHSGDWRRGRTCDMAYSLNCPMYVKFEHAHEGILPGNFSFVSMDSENVVLETIKKAENSDDIIIRMYECFNRRSTTNIKFFKELEYAYECDLMENNIGAVDVNGCGFEFEIKPYEIKTFKIKLKK